MFILKVNGEPIANRNIVSIVGDNTVEVKQSSDGPEVKLTDPRDYAEWYADFIHSKQHAMLNGGAGERYLFTKPLVSTCVRTINGTTPDTLGNITLLGSKIVDVSVPADPDYANTVVVSRLSSGSSQLELLKELYLFTMRLYDAFNHCTSRLLEFSPETWSSSEANKLGKHRGTLLNYQANVARWNYLVWKSSYRQLIEVSRQNIAISVGYACVPCRVSGVEITTTIKKVSAHATDMDGVDSAYCLTIYRQSVSDNRQRKDATVSTVIKKSDENGDVEIFGFGQDAEYKNWETITIVQKLPAMVQADKYAELFALAPGMGLTEYIYLDKESNPNSRKNDFDITTQWIVMTEQGDVTLEKTHRVSVAAVNAETIIEDEESEA